MRLLFTVLCAVFACELSYASVLVGPEFSIYGGISDVFGGPRSIFFNTTYPERDVPNKYSNSGYDFTGGIGIAYDVLMGAKDNNNIVHDVSVGLDWFVFNTIIKGDVLQFGNSAFNNFTYNFNLNTTRFMFDGRLNFRKIRKVTPFLIAGVGLSSVRAKYFDTPKLAIQNFDGGVNLPSNTNHNVAYALGMGLKVPLSKKVHLSLSYLYTDLGRAQTGAALLSPVAGTIDPVTMQLRTQTGLVGITYALN